MSAGGTINVLRVSAIHVYPIKSCAGIAVPAARVEKRGLQFDRRYMLIDANNRFVTQRQMPSMALLRTSIAADTLQIGRPDGETLELPLEPRFSEVDRVTVWRSELDACVADAQINDWFTDYLGRPVRLVYMADDQHRQVSRMVARPGDEVSFADGAPILLIGEASLAALNERLSEPVTMQRFRPNIVVDTTQPFVEDRWRHIRIGESKLEVAWSCTRCTITTIDPQTGTSDRHGEPLRTLREFRREHAGVMFGRNVLIRSSGPIAIGDRLDLIEDK